MINPGDKPTSGVIQEFLRKIDTMVPYVIWRSQSCNSVRDQFHNSGLLLFSNCCISSPNPIVTFQ